MTTQLWCLAKVRVFTGSAYDTIILQLQKSSLLIPLLRHDRLSKGSEHFVLQKSGTKFMQFGPGRTNLI